MPPKTSTKVQSKPTSSSLVKVGPRDVQKSSRNGKREGTTERPSTTRAIVLRNGKYGARGTGELMLSRLTGREKLDILAEDLIKQSRSAVRPPLRIDDAIRIAESQLCEYLDEITNLNDPELFHGIIEADVNARVPRAPANQSATVADQSKNPSFVSAVVSNRIHNAYLLASAWRIVCDSLIELKADGLANDKVLDQLERSADLRNRYLVMFDMVSRLVNLSQAKFSVLATTAEHFAPYFKTIQDEKGESEVVFDWVELKKAGRSFLDSIVIELCFPRAPYPNTVLYSILKDAVEEAPAEAKRFPQELWNAVGDFSVSVQLQEILETPLLSPQAASWREQNRLNPREYDSWLDAQLHSLTASEMHGEFKDIIFPLIRTKSASTLRNMWKTINENYKRVCQKDINTLWGLDEGLLKPTPQWHHIRPRYTDEEDAPAPKGGKKKPLAIMDTDGNDTDDTMPDLQDVSDSSDEEFSDTEDASGHEDGEDDESGYNTDEEDELREQLKEATNLAAEYENEEVPEGVDPFGQDEDRKGNPFLKILGSLRGRMFRSSSKLKTTTKQPKPPPKPKEKPAKPATDVPKPQSHAATVESDDDEEDTATAAKKKKKKPKKKKKKTGAVATNLETVDEAASTEAAPAPEPAPPPAPGPPATAAKSAKQTPPSPAKTPAARPAVVPPAFGTSQTSLVPETSTAQSARSYVQAEGIEVKSKVKSRPAHGTLLSSVKGILGRFGSQETQTESKTQRRQWFGGLPRKTKNLLHQLLNTAEDDTRGMTGMKWDDFVKLMTDMGFTFDPSTAGSSVRFDPPDGRDRAISFHKPHPHTTIERITLKKWSKKLQKYYGWKPDDVLI